MRMTKAGIAILLGLATTACTTMMSPRDAVFRDCIAKTSDAKGCADAAYRLHPETGRLAHIVWPPI